MKTYKLVRKETKVVEERKETSTFHKEHKMHGKKQ